jgi:hypothetical protein
MITPITPESLDEHLAHLGHLRTVVRQQYGSQYAGTLLVVDLPAPE